MIETRTGLDFTGVFIGPAGLTNVGIKVEDLQNNVLTPRTELGINETDPGIYVKNNIPAIVDPGQYLAIWDDGGGNSTTEEIQVYSSLIPDGVVPSVKRVAVLIRARTKVRGSGQEVGDFVNESPETRPTRWQAIEAINEAAKEVIGQTGSVIPDAAEPNVDAYRDATSAVISLLAAMTIESSFFAEQVDSGRSNYQALERRYKDAIKRLVAAVGQAGGSTAGEDSSGDGGYLRPSYDFGDRGPGTRLDTQF